MKRFIEVVVFWEWLDFGLSFNICKQTEWSEYYIGISIQIAWFDLWVQLWRKERTGIFKKL